MNTKQIKSLRRAIREKYPNAEPSFIKQIIKTSKKDFEQLTNPEKNKLNQGDK